MNNDVDTFLKTNRIGVVSVEMPNGAPHGATIHFAYQKDPFTFVFLTDRSYKKSEPMLGGKTTRASFVVGTDESSMKTFQSDGVAQFTEDPKDMEIYFSKFPEKRERYEAPDDVFIVFKPTWWRYTDFKAPGGMKIQLSE